MSTRTSFRSRLSIVACASLLTAWSVAERAAAQDSPEFGEEEVSEAPEASPDESLPTDAAPMEAETPAADRGYSDSAPTAADLAPEGATATAETDPLAPALSATVDLGFFSAGADETEGSRLTVSPLLGVGLGLSDRIEVGVQWGLAYQDNGAPEGAASQAGENALVIGNPVLSITHHTQKGKTLFAFGGGVALPLASLPDDEQDLGITNSAYEHAAALRGNWSQWLWAPDRGSVTVHFASHAVVDELLFGGEAAIAALIPSVEAGDMAVAGQMAGEVGFATESVRAVLRVQGVATITPGLEDPFQVSLDPYVAWNASDAATVIARVTVNADNPAGVEGDGIWALRVGANLAL